ncbi:MAG: UDP-N-acetylmuramoyl-tripeptide--D-alanyl-D-alanine ligase [Ruminococcaceae bacterium]|nr:UDP-N-acetylmuramoyl-tripeptide--D-alanyl-D-alanine ligase [Oscillospiraceae bacterium]
MEEIYLSEIAAWCNAEASSDGKIRTISTDSRVIDENTLFIALKGERFDANDFVDDVLEKNAKAVICSRYNGKSDRVLLVEDTGKALLDIAKGYREKFNIPFVALTGSVGKTTTKGMVHAVLSEKFNTLKTQGNLNNEIGVPKTLFCIDNSHEAAVIEMGMNHFNEISRLTNAVKPDIGIITNVGTAHIENLGSREGILKAKYEITEGMEKGAPLIINGDNDMLATINTDDFEVIKFGVEQDDLYMKAENIRFLPDGSEFTAICESEQVEAFVPAVGIHNVYNALCAMCVGKKLGFTLQEASNALKNFAPEGMRQNVRQVMDYTFIEDCYNANPDSMKASLVTLNTIKKTRSIAVLGDMLELGSFSDEAHFTVGKFAAEQKTDIVLTFGEASKFTEKGAKENGALTKAFMDKDELTNYLKSILKENDTVLFKGSRSMKMEEIFQALYKEWEV